MSGSVATAVLIVNYRTYDALNRCLVSLAPYVAADDEVVVIDYESDERQLARAVDGSMPVVKAPRPDNRGFAAGVNLAAARSRAPFLLLLNPDTIVEGPVIPRLWTWLTSHPDFGVAGARVLNADGTVQRTARRFPDLTTWLGGRTTWLTRRFPQNWLSRRNLLAQSTNAPVDVDWLSGGCLMS